MNISRRDFGRLALGSGAAATLACLGKTVSAAQTSDYRAVVGLFLFGGNDGFNTIIPTDERHAAYTQLRGPTLALAKDELTPMAGTNFGMHPSFAPLAPLWEQGAMSWVMNVGTLVKPLTREEFWANPSARPSNLGSHSHEQDHWMSMRPGSIHPDGVFGRMADRLESTATTSPLISTTGASLALMGKETSPLILPLYTQFVRTGYDAGSTEPADQARNAALAAFANGPHESKITQSVASSLETSYAAAGKVNPILAGENFQVDAYFAGDTQMSRQLRLIARCIEARSSLGHARQIFYAGQGDYDTHANQVAGGRVLGAHADLLTDLAVNVKAFYDAMTHLGLADKVTMFSMSDFGRTFRGNASAGSDHGWGNAHFVIGGGLAPQKIHGLYPRLVLGAGDDCEQEGTWIPTIANEEYVGAVAKWFGVADADMPYVFPNWDTWSTNGRGPVPLFG